MSDAERTPLAPAASEGASLKPVGNKGLHDAWFRAKVVQALEDARPDIEDTEVQVHFTGRCSATYRAADEA